MKPLLHNHAGKYRGFVVLYKNWFCGFLGALRLLPRKALVIELSGKGKGRRMRVPVNKGIANYRADVRLGDGYRGIFKIIKVFI